MNNALMSVMRLLLLLLVKHRGMQWWDDGCHGRCMAGH